MSTVVPLWFEMDVYYANKLAAWVKDGGNESAMREGLLASGYTLDEQGLYRHFHDYGNSEGLSPVSLFVTDTYLHNKAAEFYNVDAPSELQIRTVTRLIYEAGLTPWDHYNLYGWREGVNPSDLFDGQQYLADKLEQLGSGWTREQMVQAFLEAGLNPITHYELYGEEEGLEAKAPPPGPAVPQIDGVPEVLQRVPLNLAIGLADFTVESADNSLLTVTLNARKGDLGGVSDADPDTPGIQIIGKAATINDALTRLTFTAWQSGESFLDIEVTDMHGQSAATYSLFSAWDTKLGLGGTEYMRIIGADDLDYEFSLPSTTWGDKNMLSFDNPLIVDAEKMAEAPEDDPPTHDDGMCWAAQASNLLAWSGWAQQSSLGVSEGTTAEDDIFEVFKDSFLYGETEGGDGKFGFQWFFDGTYPEPEEEEEAGDQPLPDTGNYLELDVEDYLCAVTLVGEDPSLLPIFLETAFDLGIGVAVDVLWYREYPFPEDKKGGGHAITCWGYTYDSSYESDAEGVFNTEYLTGLIVSDSDDNRMTPPEEAPDRLKILDLSWDADTRSYFTTSYDGSYGQVFEAFLLLPNSAFFDAEPFYTALAEFGESDTVELVGLPLEYDMMLDAVA